MPHGFNANPPRGQRRCEASRAPLRGDSPTERPQCMRRAKVGNLCRQHARPGSAAHPLTCECQGCVEGWEIEKLTSWDDSRDEE